MNKDGGHVDPMPLRGWAWRLTSLAETIACICFLDQQISPHVKSLVVLVSSKRSRRYRIRTDHHYPGRYFLGVLWVWWPHGEAEDADNQHVLTLGFTLVYSEYCIFDAFRTTLVRTYSYCNFYFEIVTTAHYPCQYPIQAS